MEAIIEQIETEYDDHIITHGADCLKLIGAQVRPCENITPMRITLAYLIGQSSAKLDSIDDEDFANGIVAWLAVTHDRNIIAMWNRLVVSETT